MAKTLKKKTLYCQATTFKTNFSKNRQTLRKKFVALCPMSQNGC